MIGQTFGHLKTVKEGSGKTYKNGQKRKTWICKCDCGGETEVVTSKLRNGHTKSCGCRAGGILILTDTRFGRLVVIKRDGLITKSPAWLCKCDCGNTKRVRGDYLRQGSAKSCGCFQQENRCKKGRWKIKKTVCQICGKDFEYNAPTHPLTCSEKCRKQHESESHKRNRKFSEGRKWKTPIELNLSYTAKGAICRAKKHGMPCNITTDFIVGLLRKQNCSCARTGISFVLNDTGRQVGARSPWSASIDQINPSEGYTKDNVQLVCLMYNMCKNTWTDKEVKYFAQQLIKEKK